LSLPFDTLRMHGSMVLLVLFRVSFFAFCERKKRNTKEDKVPPIDWKAETRYARALRSHERIADQQHTAVRGNPAG
jgi:hypothetical protein